MHIKDDWSWCLVLVVDLGVVGCRLWGRRIVVDLGVVAEWVLLALLLAVPQQQHLSQYLGGGSLVLIAGCWVLSAGGWLMGTGATVASQRQQNSPFVSLSNRNNLVHQRRFLHTLLDVWPIDLASSSPVAGLCVASCLKKPCPN